MENRLQLLRRLPELRLGVADLGVEPSIVESKSSPVTQTPREIEIALIEQPIRFGGRERHRPECSATGQEWHEHGRLQAKAS